MSAKEKVLTEYHEFSKKRVIFLTVSILLLLLAALYAVIKGTYDLSLAEVITAFFVKDTGMSSNIVWNIRIPRVLTAVIVGTGLAVAGAVNQSILRNPLASPFTLGISSAAAFGAAFSLGILGTGTTSGSTANAAVIINNPYITTVCAFASSLIATFVILALARYKGATPETMVLAGVALGSLFSAGTSAIQFFSDDVKVVSIVFWTFGDVGRAGWRDIWILLVIIIPAVIYYIRNSWNYDALKAGDETAKSLGVNVEKVRLYGMVIASLIAAVAVSFVGIIGFVGLVVPHIVRKLIGGKEMYLIPASCLVGGLLLLVSDTVARIAFSPVVLPVGIITSFLGAPLFLYLIIKRREYW
jgi:iron complex transport system permease protein